MTDKTVVVVETADIGDINHSRLKMPVLFKTGKTLLINPMVCQPVQFTGGFIDLLTLIFYKDVLFHFNAQHDCFEARCPIVKEAIRQGREETARQQDTITHESDSCHIINMHALHNAHLIRETLPRHLTKPEYIFPDRRAKHNELAEALQRVNPIRRAEAVAKAAETCLRRKQTKTVQSGTSTGRMQGGSTGRGANNAVSLEEEEGMQMDVS